MHTGTHTCNAPRLCLYLLVHPIIHSVASVMDAHLFGSSMCVPLCVRVPTRLSSPRPVTRYKTAPASIHPTCFAKRNRYETDSHDR